MSLATNWRFTGDLYVSEKDGSDINVGNLQSAPLKTLTALIAKNFNGEVVVRSSYFNEGGFINNNPNLNNTNNKIMICDGNVFIDGSGFFPFYRGSPAKNQGFYFLYANLININEITCGAAINRSIRFFECVVKNSLLVDIGSETIRTIFLNCTLTAKGNTELGVTAIFRCTFVNSQITTVNVGVDFINFLNCYFDSDCTLAKDGPNQLNNCAFAPSFVIDGVEVQNITLDGDGDTIGNIYTDGEKFSGFLTLGSDSFAFFNCFYTVTPGFNDPTSEDYTLKLTPQSPLFNESNIIGKYGLHFYANASHIAFDVGSSGVSYVNITNTGTTFELTAPGQGTVTSSDDPTKALELPLTTTLTEFIQWFGDFQPFNGEWIDRLNYDDGVNDEVRLTVEMQVYDENEPNGVNNPLNWSVWYEIEWRRAFELDNSMLGNGDVNADMIDLNPVTGKRFRVRFVMRDNGV